MFWIFLDYWIFWILCGFFEIFPDTGHQKWPKIGQNSIIGFFWSNFFWWGPKHFFVGKLLFLQWFCFWVAQKKIMGVSKYKDIYSFWGLKKIMIILEGVQHIFIMWVQKTIFFFSVQIFLEGATFFLEGDPNYIFFVEGV